MKMCISSGAFGDLVVTFQLGNLWRASGVIKEQIVLPARLLCTSQNYGSRETQRQQRFMLVDLLWSHELVCQCLELRHGASLPTRFQFGTLKITKLNRNHALENVNQYWQQLFTSPMINDLLLLESSYVMKPCTGQTMDEVLFYIYKVYMKILYRKKINGETLLFER